MTTLWALVWLAPNSQQIMANYKPALEMVTSASRVRWQPNIIWIIATTFAFIYAFTEMGKVSEFLYFQF